MTHKYHAKKTVYNGITFDSKGEARRYAELRMLERAGRIKDLRMQVPISLIPSIYFDKETQTYYFDFEKPYKKGIVCIQREKKYVADFVYIEDGVEIVEDFKGYRTDEYKHKKNMLKKLYGIEIRETGCQSKRK